MIRLTDVFIGLLLCFFFSLIYNLQVYIISPAASFLYSLLYSVAAVVFLIKNAIRFQGFLIRNRFILFIILKSQSQNGLLMDIKCELVNALTVQVVLILLGFSMFPFVFGAVVLIFHNLWTDNLVFLFFNGLTVLALYLGTHDPLTLHWISSLYSCCRGTSFKL